MQASNSNSNSNSTSDADGDNDAAVAGRTARDDALLAEATAPHALQDARDAYLFWQHRVHALPVHKRAERKEAEQMAARWKARLAEAERERYGPGLVEQLLSVLGVRRAPTLPSRHKMMVGVSLVALVAVLVLVALLVALVVFWPQLQPIVQTLLAGQRGDGG